MSVRILPVVQMLFSGLIMQLVSILLPFANTSFFLQEPVAAIVAATGLLLVLAGGALFRRHETTFNPHTPGQASTLVVTGVYRYSRNPMYLGFLLLLIAWCIFIGNLFNILILPLFVLSITTLNIKAEEHALSARFGKRYMIYSKQVRRWL